MNGVESKKLLTEFDKLASQMGDVLARIKEIADETMSVNKALHANPVADSIICYEDLGLADLVSDHVGSNNQRLREKLSDDRH